MEKIAELENLKPTEEETEAEYQKLADAYNMPLESVKNLVTVEGINSDIQNQKAIDFIRENAVIKEGEAEKKEEAKPAKKRTTRKKAETAEGEEAPKKTRAKASKKEESSEEKTEG